MSSKRGEYNVDSNVSSICTESGRKDSTDHDELNGQLERIPEHNLLSKRYISETWELVVDNYMLSHHFIQQLIAWWDRNFNQR